MAESFLSVTHACINLQTICTCTSNATTTTLIIYIRGLTTIYGHTVWRSIGRCHDNHAILKQSGKESLQYHGITDIGYLATVTL